MKENKRELESLGAVHTHIYTGSASGYLTYKKIGNIDTSIKCLLCDKQW